MRCNAYLSVGLLLCASVQADDAPRISTAKEDDQGILIHEIESPYQPGKPQLRVLVPDVLENGRKYPVVYVLPVEAEGERRYGNGLVEVKKLELANKYGAIFVAPDFAQLPWY